MGGSDKYIGSFLLGFFSTTFLGYSRTWELLIIAIFLRLSFWSNSNAIVEMKRSNFVKLGSDEFAV